MFDAIAKMLRGPNATGGMGSGGNPELGRKAARESCEQIAATAQSADGNRMTYDRLTA